MNLKKPFSLKVKPTEEIIKLLESVTLGSNGARYKHLDTRKKIKQLYRPLFLTLEWNEKLMGNITFCRRDCGWYVRYFAFSDLVQAQKSQRKNKNEGFLKKELKKFFKNAIESTHEDHPELFYAYIDPKNTRSLWMSQQFGFEVQAKIATQTFSRIKPKEIKNVRALTDQELDKHSVILKEHYKNHQLYFAKHTFNKFPFYGYFDDSGKLLATVKVQLANWRLERLSGKAGGLITRAIPFIPGVRKIIKPNNYYFSTAETVWVDQSLDQKEQGKTLCKLFEGVLFHEKTNSLIWWVDKKEKTYRAVKSLINWGLMHNLNGVNEVDLVTLGKTEHLDKNQPFFTTAFDFI